MRANYQSYSGLNWNKITESKDFHSKERLAGHHQFLNISLECFTPFPPFPQNWFNLYKRELSEPSFIHSENIFSTYKFPASF